MCASPKSTEPADCEEPVATIMVELMRPGPPKGTTHQFLLLYFASDRLIVAELGRTSFHRLVLLGLLLSVVGMGIYTELSRRKAWRAADALEALPPAKVLSANPSNYAVAYGEIDTVEFKPRSRVRIATVEVTAGGVHRLFGTADTEGFDVARKALPEVLAGKVRIL